MGLAPQTNVLGNDVVLVSYCRVGVRVIISLVSLLYSAFIARFGNQLYCIEKCVCVVM